MTLRTTLGTCLTPLRHPAVNTTPMKAIYRWICTLLPQWQTEYHWFHRTGADRIARHLLSPMALKTCLLIIQAAFVGDAAAQVPAAEAPAHVAVIARIREAALAYGDRLQNFACVQTMARSIGPSADGPRWKPLETQEFELNYVDHREHYELIKVNGKATDLRKRIKPGYFRGYGQFGSALLNIFDPKTDARFEWDHAESGPLGSVCVFHYQVSPSSSNIVITADKDQVKVGHRGTIWANCDSGAVTRFVTETDSAEVHRMGRRVPLGYRLDVHYGPVSIGSTEFLLPQSAIQTALFYKTWTKAEIKFQQYRKYDANSTIKYDYGEPRLNRD